jgi:HD-GYP domain-containing protein (c-di-GMP phosphodiesterase class II)
VAVAELRENAGSQFDPRVVETLMRVLEGEATPSDKPADVLTAA